jgi:hypothetical protein
MSFRKVDVSNASIRIKGDNSLQFSGMRYEIGYRTGKDAVTIAQVRLRTSAQPRFSICIGEYRVGNLSQTQLHTLKAGRLSTSLKLRLERESNLELSV